jgi:hypothetical protein
MELHPQLTVAFSLAVCIVGLRATAASRAKQIMTRLG